MSTAEPTAPKRLPPPSDCRTSTTFSSIFAWRNNVHYYLRMSSNSLLNLSPCSVHGAE